MGVGGAGVSVGAGAVVGVGGAVVEPIVGVSGVIVGVGTTAGTVAVGAVGEAAAVAAPVKAAAGIGEDGCSLEQATTMTETSTSGGTAMRRDDQLISFTRYRRPRRTPGARYDEGFTQTVAVPDEEIAVTAVTEGEGRHETPVRRPYRRI